MKKTKKFIYIGIVLITMALISTLYFEEEISQKITTIITVITALIGAAALFIQYKRDKEINQASFIVEYAKYFHSLPNVDELSILLEKYRLKQEATIKEEHYAAIVNYLVWCEGLSLLVQKQVLDIATIDNLFSYNFFLITNNKYIQKLELVPQAEYYKGIYTLHKIWSDYKKKTNQPILNNDESLNQVDNYEILVKKGDIFCHKNY